MKPKVSRREKITKHRPKTNETQTKKTIERVNKTKSFKKKMQTKQTNLQIDSPRKREDSNKIRKERGALQLIPQKYKDP